MNTLYKDYVYNLLRDRLLVTLSVIKGHRQCNHAEVLPPMISPCFPVNFPSLCKDFDFFLQEASIQLPSLTALLRFVNHFEACSNGSLQR